MSAVTTYTCNICRKIIERNLVPPAPDAGFALRWSINAKHTLEFNGDWLHCPLHICCRCIDTLDVLIQQIKEKKEMT